MFHSAARVSPAACLPGNVPGWSRDDNRRRPPLAQGGAGGNACDGHDAMLPTSDAHGGIVCSQPSWRRNSGGTRRRPTGGRHGVPIGLIGSGQPVGAVDVHAAGHPRISAASERLHFPQQVGPATEPTDMASAANPFCSSGAPRPRPSRPTTSSAQHPPRDDRTVSWSPGHRFFGGNQALGASGWRTAPRGCDRSARHSRAHQRPIGRADGHARGL